MVLKISDSFVEKSQYDFTDTVNIPFKLNKLLHQNATIHSTKNTQSNIRGENVTITVLH